MGDGAGKAIGGLARLGNSQGRYTHRILLLDRPVKLNHIECCRQSGIEILGRSDLNQAISQADVVIISWWGGRVMDEFLAGFQKTPCRVLLWSHVNGYFPPKFPDGFVKQFDGLLATSRFTLQNPDWNNNSELVYGFGDFSPANIVVKSDYTIKDDLFKIGYVGMPGYKRFPPNAMDYFAEVIKLILGVKFIMAGEVSDEFRTDIKNYGFEQYFEFLGWVDNVNDLLLSFDVFGYLMKQDTTATTENSVIEAMAVALPCVVSKRPIGKYLLDDNISGILIDNPSEYANVMYRIYRDIVLRESLGRKALEYVVDKYNAYDNLARFNSACERVVERGKL